MKIFTGKGMLKKIIIVLIAIILFSTIIQPKITYAEDDVVSSVGGSLLSPIASLMIGLGDAFMNLIHDLVYDMDTCNIVIALEDDGWKIILSILIGVAIAVGIAILAYYTAGAGLAILSKLGVAIIGTKIGIDAIGTIVKISVMGGLVTGTITALNWFGKSMVFPMYTITPEEIFRGEIDMLNINFFKKDEEVEKDIVENGKLVEHVTSVNYLGAIDISDLNEGEMYFKDKLIEYGYVDLMQYSMQYPDLSPNNIKFDNDISFKTEVYSESNEWYDYFNWNVIRGNSYDEYTAELHTEFYVPLKDEEDNEDVEALYEYTYTLTIKANGSDVLKQPIIITNKHILVKQAEVEKIDISNITTADGKDEYTILKLYDSQENLEKIVNKRFNDTLQSYGYEGEINVYSAAIWLEGGTEFKWSGELGGYKAKLRPYVDGVGNFTTFELDIYKWRDATLAMTLRPTVSKWYNTIRNFVLVVMMVILLYIGIRIILSGISSEKAKYKNMLVDWVVAIFLVFIMHYIMSFAMNIVDGITDVFSSLANEDSYINNYEVSDEVLETLKNELRKPTFGMSEDEIDDRVLKKDGLPIRTEKNEESGGNNLLFEWDAGNMLGLVRIQAALCNAKSITYIGYAMAYLVLVLYTIFFLFTYMRRALYLAFFTIIAPLVAMTYPIDKIHDGKAQAFNIWLKEYIFNLMIQPIHLLLYTILIGSALDLSANVIYMLVAIGFMMPAEKFLRKMFGFDKAQTPGFLSGAAGAALAVTGMNRLFNRSHGRGGGSNKDYDDGKSSDNNTVKRYKETDSGLLLNSADSDANATSAEGTQATGQNRKRRPRKLTLGNYRANSTTNGAKGSTGGTNGFRPLRGSSSVPDTNAEEKKKLGFIRRHLRAIGKSSKRYANAKLTRAARNIKSGKTIRDIAKFAGGAYLGLGGALIGATMGVASGDLKNVGQYAGTLGAAGIALGAREPKIDPDIGNAYEEYQRELADSPEEYELEKQGREFIDKENNAQKIKDLLGCKSLGEARKRMEDFVESIYAGIDNPEDLATIIKLSDEGIMDREMATVAAQYYKIAGGKPKNMDPSSNEYKRIRRRCENIARDKGITNPKDIDNSVNEIFKKLNTFGSTKDKLTKV